MDSPPRWLAFGAGPSTPFGAFSWSGAANAVLSDTEPLDPSSADTGAWLENATRQPFPIHAWLASDGLPAGAPQATLRVEGRAVPRVRIQRGSLTADFLDLRAVCGADRPRGERRWHAARVLEAAAISASTTFEGRPIGDRSPAIFLGPLAAWAMTRWPGQRVFHATACLRRRRDRVEAPTGEGTDLQALALQAAHDVVFDSLLSQRDTRRRWPVCFEGDGAPREHRFRRGVTAPEDLSRPVSTSEARAAFCAEQGLDPSLPILGWSTPAHLAGRGLLPLTDPAALPQGVSLVWCPSAAGSRAAELAAQISHPQLRRLPMQEAPRLIAVADIWFDPSRRPLGAYSVDALRALRRASEPDGFQAKGNGVEAPVLWLMQDGWWAQVHDGTQGFAVPASPSSFHPRLQDAQDAAHFYRILEDEVLPAFHDRSRWRALVQGSQALAEVLDGPRCLAHTLECLAKVESHAERSPPFA